MKNEYKKTEYAFAMLDSNSNYTQYGLTKREYFAAMAMQGMFANGQTALDGEGVDYVAKLSKAAADELLKQLEL